MDFDIIRVTICNSLWYNFKQTLMTGTSETLALAEEISPDVKLFFKYNFHYFNHRDLQNVAVKMLPFVFRNYYTKKKPRFSSKLLIFWDKKRLVSSFVFNSCSFSSKFSEVENTCSTNSSNFMKFYFLKCWQVYWKDTLNSNRT